jgi:hypothetical protein
MALHDEAESRRTLAEEGDPLAPSDAPRDDVLLAGGVRFGSPDSVDTDLLYPVQRLPSPVEAKSLCSGGPANRNLIVVRDGVIAETYKGLPDETNNALLATYSLHQQTEPNPVTRPVKRIVPLKVIRATRLILSLVSRSIYRDRVKQALRVLNHGLRMEVLAQIDFQQLDLSADAAKAIAFQLGQTNALIDGHELYTKQAIRGHFPDLAPAISRAGRARRALNEHRDALLGRVAGVYVRQKGSLNLLMYGNALAIDQWNQYARQCRGVVIDLKTERCVFFPMDKFFRFGEGPEVSRDALPPDSPVEIVEKLDGSMVALLAHEGTLQFCCKGNFDTPQSQRAEQIARSLPIGSLQTDRYWYVFEVLYPENRFPHGLGIVDYGSREDLVLTAMRDRRTNELLPYADVIREARRVGLSHPRMFAPDLAQAFRMVDSADGRLGEEGFVIHSMLDRKYFKLKYPAYKEVLGLVNEMRSDRFVRGYLPLEDHQRQATLELLPDDIRAVAHQQLQRHTGIMDRVQRYARETVARGPVDPAPFAEFVRANVPVAFQRLVFQQRRGQAASDTLEKAALPIYEGREEFPEGPHDVPSSGPACSDPGGDR